MKSLVYSVLFLLAFNLLQAEGYIPSEVQRIIDIRETEIKKIDEQYIEALKRQKVRYTKLGEFEYALLVDKLIKEHELIKKNSSDETSSKWTWINGGGELILYRDGTATHSDRPKHAGEWKHIEEDKMFLTLGPNDYRIVFRGGGIGDVIHLESGNKTMIIPKDQK